MLSFIIESMGEFNKWVVCGFIYLFVCFVYINLLPL